MKKLPKSIELAISILIISISVSLSAFAINRFLISPLKTSQPETKREINLSGYNFAENSKTLILALQSNCHFCNESAPFYKRLVEKAKGKDIKLVAVLPTSIEESRPHLDKLGLSEIEVKQSSLDDLLITGTPTLILFDNTGAILNSWVGKLPPEIETKVLEELAPKV